MSDDNPIPNGFLFDTGTPTRRCKKCNKIKPLMEFDKRPNEKNRRRQCRECVVGSRRRWDENNPNKRKRRRRKFALKQRYGLTLAAFAAMNARQHGRCAICGKEETHKDKVGKVQPLCVDHNHQTKKVRELLCNACNHVLGACREDIGILLKAIEYLKKHNT